MDDYISREKALQFRLPVNASREANRVTVARGVADAIAEYIKAISPADVRPVVLCRDCEHCEIWDENNGIYYCVGGRPGSSVNPAEDFCSKAKRRGAKLGGTYG